MESTSKKTVDYIKEHPHIKNCLAKGLINYSSLSRYIGEELGISKKTSMEAILIACRRFRDDLKKEVSHEKKVVKLLRESEINIKNKVHVLIVSKKIKLPKLEKSFVIEGSDYLTVITFDKNVDKIDRRMIVEHHKDLVLISIKSGKEIEKLTGVVSYVTSLFSENGVNVVEFISCWRDTMFVIKSKDVNKVIEFLNF